MKKILFIFCFSFLFLYNISTFAQGETAVPFLLLQPSPSLSALGQTGTALPTEDPFVFLWNPAQLGYTSQTNNLSYIFYPSKLDWLGFNELELKGIAFNTGFNFKDLIGFPLSFGFGYSKVEVDFGEFYNPFATYEDNDYYNAFSLGFGVDYFVQLNFGYTIKEVTSILHYYGEGGPEEIKAETTVNDFGILLNVPVLRLVDDKMNVELDEGLFAKPAFNFSLGYSKSNIGDEIYYFDKSQTDPLPRMDRIGYGISTGFDLVTDDFSINAFNLSFTVEADDILISREYVVNNGDTTSPTVYKSTLSDLKFWKNIVKIEGNNKIVSHAGTKLDFVETVTLYFGHFSGRGFYSEKTSGYEFRAKGLLKLYALWAKHPITDFLRDHIDIRYYNSDFFMDDFTETNMTGLAFYVHNLNELF